MQIDKEALCKTLGMAQQGLATSLFDLVMGPVQALKEQIKAVMDEYTSQLTNALEKIQKEINDTLNGLLAQVMANPFVDAAALLYYCLTGKTIPQINISFEEWERLIEEFLRENIWGYLESYEMELWNLLDELEGIIPQDLIDDLLRFAECLLNCDGTWTGPYTLNGYGRLVQSTDMYGNVTSWVYIHPASLETMLSNEAGVGLDGKADYTTFGDKGSPALPYGNRMRSILESKNILKKTVAAMATGIIPMSIDPLTGKWSINGEDSLTIKSLLNQYAIIMARLNTLTLGVSELVSKSIAIKSKEYVNYRGHENTFKKVRELSSRFNYSPLTYALVADHIEEDILSILDKIQVKIGIISLDYTDAVNAQAILDEDTILASYEDALAHYNVVSNLGLKIESLLQILDKMCLAMQGVGSIYTDYSQFLSTSLVRYRGYSILSPTQYQSMVDLVMNNIDLVIYGGLNKSNGDFVDVFKTNYFLISNGISSSVGDIPLLVQD